MVEVRTTETACQNEAEQLSSSPCPVETELHVEPIYVYTGLVLHRVHTNNQYTNHITLTLQKIAKVAVQVTEWYPIIPNAKPRIDICNGFLPGVNGIMQCSVFGWGSSCQFSLHSSYFLPWHQFSLFLDLGSFNVFSLMSNEALKLV
jgi:hypothetical protein